MRAFFCSAGEEWHGRPARRRHTVSKSIRSSYPERVGENAVCQAKAIWLPSPWKKAWLASSSMDKKMMPVLGQIWGHTPGLAPHKAILICGGSSKGKSAVKRMPVATQWFQRHRKGFIARRRGGSGRLKRVGKRVIQCVC